MKISLLRWLQLLAFLGMTVALNGCGETVNTNDKEKKVLPTIEAKIGDTWDEAIQHSTFKLGPLPTPVGFVTDQPHTFIYRDPHHRMQLDNVGYMNVNVGYGHTTIRSFGIGVYRQSAETDETWRRLQDIARQMEQAGWILDDEMNKHNPVSKSADQLRKKYINLPGGAQGVQKIWYDDYGNEAWVLLAKTITGHEPGEEPRFNVVLQIQVALHPKKSNGQK
ncbi:hypothetical protein F506_19065 [Herbaspirillum hiltneri N3]|uniref:Lipoprotein n=1 Tax=Herbaspirillum hiltneri N3 TaxID=1262470 RepID=A0ABM5V4C5_9BURK|nr:hypothetical protein [Herbaspirillum hiltneri]AKZ64477.1 hypothetical protein F506_19065 [Herbaspirillum hiltneri N3]